MQTKKNATENMSTQVNTVMPWRVAKVEVLPHYKLQVKFMDGLSGIVDMSKLILSPEAGIFNLLKDTKTFKQVHTELGVVTWPGEIDLAPDAMYDAIKETGQWILA
jgi:hypothetical protein